MEDTAVRVDMSVIVPVYNSAHTLPELCERVRAAMMALGISHELVLVDDGSSDGSFQAIKIQAEKNPAIRAVKMLRNFGQHPAITAGMAHAQGDWMVLMDDDLQTPPEEIGKLYAKAKEGYDVVCGARMERKDSLGRRLGSRVANQLMAKLFGIQAPDTISSFRLMSRRVVNSYLRLPENHTYAAALISWLGYPQTSVSVRHEPSKVGRSRYGYWKLLKIWLNIGFGFSDTPLKLASWGGVLISVIAGALGLRVLWIYFMIGSSVPGYASLFVAQMFFFGVTLLSLGILGEYISRVYREVKHRPYFVVDYQKSIGVVEPAASAKEAD